MYSLTDWILRGCLFLVSGYGLLLLFARFFAEGHVFLRSKMRLSWLAALNYACQVDVNYHYILESAAPQPKILLYNHGSNQDLEDLLPTLAELQANGYNVLAYDYRLWDQHRKPASAVF